jgi:MTH538 TIR-like domain (DUF1863)
MTRKIFFSFHYERDAWRAGQVRNCNIVAGAGEVAGEDEYGFIDAVDWESIKKKGDAAVEKWIDDQLKYTSVTVVLVGAETASRDWVRHEIVKSWNRGNGIVVIRIHNIKDQQKKTDMAGSNPLDAFKLPDGTILSSICKTYDWVVDNGRENLGKWADDAAKIRSKYGKDDTISEAEPTSSPHIASAAGASAGFTPRSPWCGSADKNR